MLRMTELETRVSLGLDIQPQVADSAFTSMSLDLALVVPL